ncbi:nucleotidyltransferase [Paenibacillus sp. 598K]|uniref:phosphocholine cytidylyltransferase family protein n=1 Tax=Paenibacillus sp. 598K TaxID=1117987 RepID=UPI000FF93AA4|nr:phosphocholine cytidylyltransferase family protein [Paenibacillus sp. 598K]GBF74320.1 nucleotidyltransferase [Paenibacillus sp. 598K]
MRAILLAAGRGSRLGELTEEEPKCRTMLLGKRLIDRQLEALRAAGIREIAIVRGYRAERIQVEDVTYYTNAQWSDTNMVASLCCAASWLEQGPCLVSYTDIVYSQSAIELLLRGAPDADIAIPYSTQWRALWEARFDDPLTDAETFRLTANGDVAEIGGVPATLEEVEGQFMGLLRLTPAGWRTIRKFLDGCSASEQARMDVTSLLAGLLGQGEAIAALPYEGLWLEVDRASDLHLYEQRYRRVL